MLKGLGRVLVVDFSKLLPGPFASMVLADLGCRVVRVELPYWPDPVREVPPKIDGQGFCYWMVNRNKESLSLDFRKPAGREVLMRLLARADAVLEGFRPGLMTRLGLGPKELLKRFPRLVYCSLTGYGRQGPLGAKAGHDLNFLAMSGFLSLGDSEGRLSFPPVQFADLAGSMYAATAVLGALAERGRTGRGRRVEVSCAEALASWQVLALGETLAGAGPVAPRSRWWNGAHPFYRLYRTKDGRRLAVGALERVFADALLDAVGLSRFKRLLEGPFPTPPASLGRELSKVLAKRTLAQWRRVFAGKDACVTPVLTLKEALRGAPAGGTVALAPVPGPRRSAAGGASPRRTLASPMRFPGAAFRVRRPPPPLGADTARVLRELGYSAAAAGRLKAAGVC